MSNRVLISTAAYDGYNLATAIAEIAALGADGIEVAFIEGYTDPFTEDTFCRAYADEVCEQLALHNLSCCSFSAHMDLTKPNAVEIFLKRMKFANMLGADTIITNAAPTIRKEEFLKNIQILGQAAQDLGMMIGLENPGDGSDNILNTAQQASQAIDEIGLESVKLNYDFGNLISHCFEKVKPEEDYKAALRQMGHYHIKDVERIPEGWGFTAIGAGMIDYQTVLAEIARDPRELTVSLEIPLRLIRGKDAKPVRATEAVQLEVIRNVLQESMGFVREALAV